MVTQTGKSLLTFLWQSWGPSAIPQITSQVLCFISLVMRNSGEKYSYSELSLACKLIEACSIALLPKPDQSLPLQTITFFFIALWAD